MCVCVCVCVCVCIRIYRIDPIPELLSCVSVRLGTGRSGTGTLFRRRAPAQLRQPEPRMRLAVRDVPKGTLRTHSA